jgi:heptosyltransferase-3
MEVPVPSSALLVVPQRIGDVLLATPVIASLKRKWPALAVDVLVFKGTEGVLAGNLQIREVIAVGQRMSLSSHLALMRRIWRRYDIAISVLCGDRPTLYAWAAGRISIGPVLGNARKQGWKRALLSRHVEFDDLSTHTVAMGLKVAALIGVEPLAEVQVRWSEEDERTAAGILRDQIGGGAFALLHPTPKYNYKKWRPEGWRELVLWLSQRGIKPVVTGSADPAESDYLRQVFPQLPDGVINLAGKLSFGVLAALLRKAALYVGPDTVVTHMAAGLEVPTIGIFGPSNPVKWGPWPAARRELGSPWQMCGSGRSGNVFLVQGEAHCVPCREEGCERHVGSYSDCLMHLPARRVMDAAAEMLRVR